MQIIGELLDQTFVDNPHSIRLFSPDELVSNKLDAVFNHTTRNFQWDEFANARGGRVIEILSEHMCQGFLQGYTLTGRTGVFPSYESFLGIIHTMMVQYSKFNKMVPFSPTISRPPDLPRRFTYRLRRPVRQPGVRTSLRSTTSRHQHGHAKNTTVSHTKTLPLSAQFSILNLRPLAYTFRRTQTLSLAP